MWWWYDRYCSSFHWKYQVQLQLSKNWGELTNNVCVLFILIWTHITQNHYARHLSNTSEHTVVYPISIPLYSIRSFFSNRNIDDNWIAGTLMLLCSKDIHFCTKLFCFSLMHIHINHLSHKHFWNQILETIESRRSLNVDRFHLTSTLRHQLPTL